MNNKTNAHFPTRSITHIALCTTLLILCAWIKIPFTVPFTMQSFAVFLAPQLLGGKRATLCVLIYILLGIIGLPVFSGFTGGVSILFGATGGFIFGFLAIPLLYWATSRLHKNSKHKKIIVLFAGQCLCYLSGSLWYVTLYIKNFSLAGFISVLSICVLPFLLPDILKLVLSFSAANKLNKHN